MVGLVICASVSCGGDLDLANQDKETSLGKTKSDAKDDKKATSSIASASESPNKPEAKSDTGTAIKTPIPKAEVTLNPADEPLSFIPALDGFGFANFSGGQNASTILTEDLVEFFGRDGLCLPGEEHVKYSSVEI